MTRAAATKVRHKRDGGGGLNVQITALVLGCCCLFSLIVSFLNGSVLMSSSHNNEHPPQPPQQHHVKLPLPSSASTASVKKVDVALFGRSMVLGKNVTGLVVNNKHLGSLDCRAYGGPHEASQEMVYWQEIPEDELYVSPFMDPENPKYITFEPDPGGFNNIRMSMETVLAMAVAMGRVLVLPPPQKMYLLNKQGREGASTKQNFGFEDFFPIEDIAQHVKGLEIISTETFLERQAITGHLRSHETGKVLFPPGNKTNWEGQFNLVPLDHYLRQVGSAPADWDPKECMAAIPATPGNDATLTFGFQEIVAQGGFPSYEKYVGQPTSVRASVKERWMEHGSERSKLCLYDKNLQSQSLLHFAGKKGLPGARLLTHFYTFLFFEDWKTDLWMKRFVRDRVRYNDEIQCAAARIVKRIREHVQKRLGSASFSREDAPFDAFHVRRGDFQYKKTRVSADVMYDMARKEIPDGTTLYIATDEVKNKSFFDPLAQHYDLLFLDDFMEEIPGMNPNFFGMLDQLVATRSRTFFGCWFSTFTGYILRLKGYDSDLHKLPGFAHGILDAYFYAPPDKKFRAREYWPISGSHYAREFPTAWRNIDHW